MNVGSETAGKGRRRDFDLNLAPIIDCFTVLIAFMLVSSGFLAIGILDAGAGITSTTTDPNAKAQAINLEIHLGMQHDLQIKVTGKEKADRLIASEKGEWNLKELTAQIDSLKAKWPDTRFAVLIPQDTVSYVQLIKVMEALKPHLASVLLGGF